MPNPAPVSRWPGLVRRTALSCAAAVLLGGCAMQSLMQSRSTDQLEFLDRAMSGGPAAREAMWREIQSENRSPETSLRLALLQSVPDHSGSDPAAAQRNLRALLAQNPPSDLAAVARVRLDELRDQARAYNASNQCVGENQELRRRLAEVVRIERQLDNRGH